jgi:hypothetical protein
VLTLSVAVSPKAYQNWTLSKLIVANDLTPVKRTSSNETIHAGHSR